jgi:hypothetical protein
MGYLKRRAGWLVALLLPRVWNLWDYKVGAARLAIRTESWERNAEATWTQLCDVSSEVKRVLGFRVASVCQPSYLQY